MTTGAASSVSAPSSASSDSGCDSLSSPLAHRIARLGCVALAGLLLANCANDQVAKRRSKEIGAFPQSKYGPASPRVVAEGEEVPKGGGRQLVGNSYTVAGKRYTPYQKPVGYTAVGNASWYGEAFHGRRTANGEVYDRNGISAAHPTMPLPAYARVTNLLNNRSIIVRVNDRGPYHSSRLMDVSQKTAEALAFRHLGTARIKLEYLGQASLAGSDDKLLLATLRTDGQPAAIPGTSAPTMVASAASVATRRSRSADLDEQQSEPPAVEQVAIERSTPISAPAAAPYTTASYSTASVSSAAAGIPVSATSAAAGTPVRGAPLPPSRPFDLDTIANAANPVKVPSTTRTVMPPPRANMASLFAAPEATPAQRFGKAHPFDALLARETLKPLARN